MSVLLKASKTDPFRQGCTLVFYALDSPICPVHAMRRYLGSRQSWAPGASDPLFVMPDHAPLTRAVLVTHLRLLLGRLGFNPTHYAGHSFRKGAATSASAAHVPDHILKVLGRWSSDCYQRYIQTSPHLIREAQLQMSFVN